MLLQVQGVFAEYERALMAERTRRGRLFAARQGRVNWGGNPPYGYRYSRKTDPTPSQLVVDPGEAAIVQQMYRWLVEEQLSSYAIQQRLTEQGLPTRGSNRQGWAQSSVIHILRSPVYKGEAWYNQTQVADARRPRLQTGLKDLRPGNRRSRTRRPQEDWIPVRVPALIDAELWRMAQEQLASNRARAARNTQHEYLLRGLLICGRCGRRLVGTWTALSHGRYICSARYPRSAPWSCEGRSVSAALVESQVWDHLKGLLAEPDLLRARYQESRGDPAIVGSDEREHVRIERQVQGIEREVQRLIDAYQIGAIALTELQDRRRRAEEHSHVLTNRLRELHQQRQAREQELRLLQGLEGFCASIHEALANPTFAVKQKVLQLVVDRIIVEDTRLVIRHVIPIGPVGLQPRHQQRKTQRLINIVVGFQCGANDLAPDIQSHAVNDQHHGAFERAIGIPAPFRDELLVEQVGGENLRGHDLGVTLFQKPAEVIVQIVPHLAGVGHDFTAFSEFGFPARLEAGDGFPLRARWGLDVVDQRFQPTHQPIRAIQAGVIEQPPELIPIQFPGRSQP
jgi:site-specific DNA recombinase